MRVQLNFETKDGEGNVQSAHATARLEVLENALSLTYMEDMSGEGKLTKCVMTLSRGQLRLIRRGEVTTDFIYSERLVHNSVYETPYGGWPVTLTTKNYETEFGGIDWEKREVSEDFFARADISYELTLGEGEAEPMRLKLSVTA